MTTKDIAINSLRELPENATWEDIQERINFIAAVETEAARQFRGCSKWVLRIFITAVGWKMFSST